MNALIKCRNIKTFIRFFSITLTKRDVILVKRLNNFQNSLVRVSELFKASKLYGISDETDLGKILRVVTLYVVEFYLRNSQIFA